MRWKSGEKADICATERHLPLAFHFPLKKESVLTRRAVPLCGSIRDGKKKEDGKMAKKQVSTLLHSHHPLALLFPLKKKNMCIFTHTKKGRRPRENSILLWFFLFLWKKNVCIFIHVLHQVEYVHTWELKKKRQKGRKGGYLRPSAAIILWFFSFPRNKKCAYLSAHQTGSKTPVHTYPHTKRGSKTQKRKEKEKKMCRHGSLHSLTFPFAFMCRHGE